MNKGELIQTTAVQSLRQYVRIPDPYNSQYNRGLKRIPVGVSARHVHLTTHHVEALFGPGYKLTAIKDLQPGQFACQETVTLVGSKGAMYRVRILGPTRSESQVELAVTDCYKLGVKPVLRASGDISGSPGIALVGPKGALYLAQGVIVAWRHLHMTPEQAAGFDLKDGEFTQIKVTGDRSLTFDQVLVRVSASFSLELHLDTDEANAAGLKSGDEVDLV